MTTNIDPDAPWWANLILLALIALVPTFFAVRARHEAAKSVRIAKGAHVETTAQLGKVLHEVKNSHDKNLRDDLDDKIVQLLDAVSTVRDEVGGLHSEIRDSRFDVGRMQMDLVGIRTDARRDRRRVSAVERRLTTALTRTQDLLDVYHPQGDNQLDTISEEPAPSDGDPVR